MCRVRFWKMSGLLLCLLVSGTRLYSQPTVEDMLDYFHQGQYSQVIAARTEVMPEQPSQQVLLYYLVGRSFCRLYEEQRGKLYLNWCLERFRLKADNKQIIRTALAECSQPEPEADSTPYFAFAGADMYIETDGASVHSKVIHLIPEKNLTHTSLATFVQVVPPEEYQRRLTPIAEAESAVAKIAPLVGTEYTCTQVGHFVVASNNPDTDPTQVAGTLLAYQTFFENSFALERPDEMITAYLVKDPQSLRRLANKLHGLGLQAGTLGYCNQADRSIVAYSPPPESMTRTLCHELFHLLTAEYWDIPPWLGEGMAALYEISDIEQDGTIRGKDNWRGPILREFGQMRLPLDQLVTADWDKFNAISSDNFDLQAVNHAEARYFALYLQEEGVLADVFKACKLMSPETVVEDLSRETIRLFEDTFGKNMAEIDREFWSWFQLRPLHLQ